MDKAKRKLETELKAGLAAVDDLERVKRDLEEATKRKVEPICIFLRSVNYEKIIDILRCYA